MSGTPKRWWFQFSVRTLFALTTVFATALAWLAYERQKTQAKRNAIEAVADLRGRIKYERENPERHAWLKLLLGDDLPGEVVEVNIGGAEATHDHFTPLKSFPRLRRLSAIFVTIDDSIVDLSGLTRLEYLSIWADEFGDEGLRHVKEMPRLKELEIKGGQVTGPGLAYLEKLDGLEHIGLSSPVQDDGLKHLRKLKNLQSLNLCKTNVTDDGLDYIANLTSLEYLRLNGLKISDQGLRKLGSLAKLRILHLRYCDVTDDGLQYLADLKQLEELELGPHITNTGAQFLECLPNLKRVEFWQTRVTHSGIARLRRKYPGIDIGETGPPIDP